MRSRRDTGELGVLGLQLACLKFGLSEIDHVLARIGLRPDAAQATAWAKRMCGLGELMAGIGT